MVHTCPAQALLLGKCGLPNSEESVKDMPPGKIQKYAYENDCAAAVHQWSNQGFAIDGEAVRYTCEFLSASKGPNREKHVVLLASAEACGIKVQKEVQKAPGKGRRARDAAANSEAPANVPSNLASAGVSWNFFALPQSSPMVCCATAVAEKPGFSVSAVPRSSVDIAKSLNKPQPNCESSNLDFLSKGAGQVAACTST